jgi:hypothetical protein
MTPRWRRGNAVEDSKDTHGWIIGHFIDPTEDVRSTKDLEVKWGIHSAGEKRPEWTSGDERSTLIMLIKGHFRVELTEGSITMEREGDYAVWGPGVNHSWEALSDSVVVSVRWPSI